MSNDDDFEVVRGSGNVFADFGYPNAEVEQLKVILAARIIGELDDGELTLRKAAELTGVPAADFSRVRRLKLDRFSIERLIGMLEKFGQHVELEVSFRQKAA